MPTDLFHAPRGHWLPRVFTLFLLLTSNGCGHPRISPDAYQIAKALHSAIAQQDKPTLERAAVHIAESRDKGSISAAEYDLLAAHIVDAQNGDWEQSAASLWELLAAQNEEE